MRELIIDENKKWIYLDRNDPELQDILQCLFLEQNIMYKGSKFYALKNKVNYSLLVVTENNSIHSIEGSFETALENTYEIVKLLNTEHLQLGTIDQRFKKVIYKNDTSPITYRVASNSFSTYTYEITVTYKKNTDISAQTVKFKYTKTAITDPALMNSGKTILQDIIQDNMVLIPDYSKMCFGCRAIPLNIIEEISIYCIG